MSARAIIDAAIASAEREVAWNREQLKEAEAELLAAKAAKAELDDLEGELDDHHEERAAAARGPRG